MRKDQTLRVRLTGAQRQLVEQAANADGFIPSEWARLVLVRAARLRVRER